MGYLKLHGAPEVSDAPPFLAEAPDPDLRLGAAVNDVVNQIIGSGLLLQSSDYPMTLCLLGTEHVYAALVDTEGTGGDDFSWVPTLIEAIKGGEDEVIRDVLYFAPTPHGVVLNAWNSVGAAVCGTVKMIHPLLPLPAFVAHGHMPKKADAPVVLNLCEHIGRYLWGPHWDLVVREEDRC